MRPLICNEMSSCQPRRSPSSGRWYGVVTLLSVSLVCSSVAWGQPPSKYVTQDTTLLTKDGHEIKVSYFKSQVGQEAPVVVLLHGKGGNRLIWKGFAEQLQKVDFAVITVDLRGHGESAGGTGATSTKKPDATPKKGEYVGMVAGDLEAVKRFLFEEHQNKQLNMNKLGIVAADVTTPVAIAYTELDWLKKPFDDAPTLALSTPRGQDVQAIALLTPEEKAPGLGTQKTLAFIRTAQRPVLLCVGSKNPGDVKDAKQMYEILDPKKERVNEIYLEQYDTKLRGTDLLGKGMKVDAHLFNFLVKHVKEHRSEWRDRKNKAE